MDKQSTASGPLFIKVSDAEAVNCLTSALFTEQIGRHILLNEQSIPFT